eukprot:gnl/MRDRNA2_/MRDRNA2_79705_c0_seq1.p1 gnl/MRDRNA2_/MRDRNA2_79705_c0~~gnl/MRDRNA2_/MRDRNA2_79705_c0_seq1.p1  ORF type:complete len:147 (+),score=23.17 gnl/MRDRNA2_/MRDRNA2_79705_c0_seq1:257-697(+)
MSCCHTVGTCGTAGYERFHFQELADTVLIFEAWGIGHCGVLLLTKLTAARQQRMRDFNLQEFARTAWATTTKCCPNISGCKVAAYEGLQFARIRKQRMGICNDGPLFATLAAAQRMKGLNSQKIVNTAWVLSRGISFHKIGSRSSA